MKPHRPLPPTPTRLARSIALGLGLGMGLGLITPAVQAQVTAPPSTTALPVLRPGGTLIGATVPVVSSVGNGPVMNISQTQARALIEWSSFNIGSAATVNVVQPTVTSILLNRVVAGTATQGPSTLAGVLQANGRVFILDPNGVLLNSTARVHTGGLLLAAMAMGSPDASFLDGSALTLVRDAAQGTVAVDAGAVIAGGSAATPAAGGDVALLGVAQTRLNGSIDATRVFIGAAGGAQIPVGDSGFITLKLTPASADLANYQPPTVSAGLGARIGAKGGQVIVQTAGAGETGVNWSADIDASGGSISMSGSALGTTGLQIQGSSATTSVPVTVQLRARDIDLSGSAGSAPGLSLAGVNAVAENRISLQGSSSLSDGVALGGANGAVNLQAPILNVLGRSATGTGVFMSASSLSGDSIDVRGVATTADASLPNDSGRVVGVDLSARFVLGANGRLSVAGRAELPVARSDASAYGLLLNGVDVSTPAGAGGSVTFAGESVNSAAGAGLFGAIGGASLFSVQGVGGSSGADVFIGGDVGGQGAVFQAASAPVTVLAVAAPTGLARAPDITTSGRVNLRPLGVDLNGNLVEHSSRAIQIGSDPSLATTPFLVPADWLAGSGPNGGGITASRLVIGSAAQQGAITVDAQALAAGTPALTLQNPAAGSGGVVLGGNVAVVPSLSILSAGPVSQTGTLRVQSLLLQGGGGNTVVLADPGNEMASLAFDRIGSLDLTRLGQSTRLPAGLSIDAVDTLGYDAAAAAFGTLSIVTSGANQRVTLHTDQLTLNSGIAMSGAGSHLDLVADSSFSSPGTAQLSAGPGGTWRVWTPSWTNVSGSVTAGRPAPNLYGCAFGDGTQCSISQIALPTNRSGFFFAQQPTLTVDPLAVSSERGQPLPALPFTLSGLVAGDTAPAALAGSLATPATALSPVGSYPVTLGNLVSPLGYRVLLADRTGLDTAFTLTPARHPPAAIAVGGVRALFDAASSETYGRNLSAPSLCLAPGAARRERQVGERQDLLGLEWGRVRLQPQLSSCLQIADEPGCAGF